MNYDNLKKNPTNFLSLTSLKVEEFEKLLSVFYGARDKILRLAEIDPDYSYYELALRYGIDLKRMYLDSKFSSNKAGGKKGGYFKKFFKK